MARNIKKLEERIAPTGGLLGGMLGGGESENSQHHSVTNVSDFGHTSDAGDISDAGNVSDVADLGDVGNNTGDIGNLHTGDVGNVDVSDVGNDFLNGNTIASGNDASVDASDNMVDASSRDN